MDTSADPALTTAKELYKDQNIPPGFVTRALSAAVSFLSPSKTVQSDNDSSGNMQQVSASPQLNTGNSNQVHLYKETPDMDPEVYHYPNPLLIIPEYGTNCK